MSQDSGSGLHVEGSRKSDGYCERCETCCKKQRVGLMTQRKICSCDAVQAHQQMLTHSKVSSRSPHVDVSPSPCSMEEGEISGSDDDDGMTSFLDDGKNKENSELIEKIYTKHMQELEKKQNKEVLAHFCSKEERKGKITKGYELQKVLIGELYGESLSKSDMLKKLDETYQTKLEGLCHEMKKCWVNLKEKHETARTNEKEMRLRMIHLLKEITASTLPEGSDKAEDMAPSTSINSGNCSSLDIVEVSPDNLPVKDMTVMHAGPDIEVPEVGASGIMAESVIPGLSSVEHLVALDDQIALDDPSSLPGCSTLPQSNLGPKDSQGQILTDLSVTEGQVPRKSVQDFNDEVGQLDIEDFEISVDCWTVEEVTLQNDQSVSNGVVPHICVISDDELMHEASAAAPANELEDANNLSEEVPSTLSVKQINPLTVERSRNELAACLSMDNLHEEAHIISDGVATQGSFPCVASASGGCDSMDQDRAVVELRQQSQTNTPADPCFLGLIGSAQTAILEQQSTYQGRQLPLEQACTTVPLRTDLQVTDKFSSLPTRQFVATASYSQQLQSSSRAFPLMMPQLVRDPLQFQLENIKKVANGAQKKHKDMLAQLAADRDRAIAKINQEYMLLDQSARNRWMQIEGELMLFFQKTLAQKLLADTWRKFISKENIPLDTVVQPSSLLQPDGLPSENSTQRNASAPYHQFPNQSSLVRCTGLPGSQRNVSGHFVSFVQDPRLGHYLPGVSNPLAGFPQFQMNRYTQNFCSSSSPTFSYSQPSNSRDYPDHPQN